MPPVTTATPPATMARFFRVLADATRLRLLAELEGGERSVGELVESVGGSQARISTHLACLRHCGLVSDERRGRQVIYRLTLPGLEGLVSQAGAVCAPLAPRLETCTRVGPDWI